MSKKVIYFDNNANTFMPKIVLDAYQQWMNRGNPSAKYKSAEESRKLMNGFRLYLASLCEIELEGKNGYSVIFTSGASESNSTIILSTIIAYKKHTGRIPHIITSEVEHSSVLMSCEHARDSGLAELTILPVVNWGIDLDDLAKSIKSNTALVTIMSANNETGVMFDIKNIGAICHKNNVPFHTDAVQLFPKSPIKPNSFNVDAFSVSFHKLHGPIGCGILVLKDSWITGYNLKGIISGTQNYELRGGTENYPAIIASFVATKDTYKGRTVKNSRLQKMTSRIIESLGKSCNVVFMEDFKATADYSAAAPVTVVLIQPKNNDLVIPNTILVAVDRPKFCNKAAVALLEKEGVIVSVGSACHTGDDQSSHVVIAMGVPKSLQKKVLRISLGDGNTFEEVGMFVKKFVGVISSDEVLVLKE